jgi:hypothetical protein
MRLHFHTVGPTAKALVGSVSALRAPASALDAASAVRGSLGVSIEHLSFSHGAGASVFLLNAGFALLFAALAIAWRRTNSREAGRIPLRATSNFAR